MKKAGRTTRVATFGGLISPFTTASHIRSASTLQSTPWSSLLSSGSSTKGIVKSGESHRAAEAGSSKRDIKLSILAYEEVSTKVDEFPGVVEERTLHLHKIHSSLHSIPCIFPAT